MVRRSWRRWLRSNPYCWRVGLRLAIVSELRRVADTGVEAVAGVQPLIVIAQGGLGVIQMSDIVFSWVFGTALIQQLPHLVLDRHAVVALLHDVVLVEHVTEEVAVIELEDDWRLDLPRQLLEPVPFVAWQCDIQGENVLHGPGVYRTVAVGCAGCRETMQESFVAFFGRTFEEATGRRGEVVLEKASGLVRALRRDFE